MDQVQDHVRRIFHKGPVVGCEAKAVLLDADRDLYICSSNSICLKICRCILAWA